MRSFRRILALPFVLLALMFMLPMMFLFAIYSAFGALATMVEGEQ